MHPLWIINLESGSELSDELSRLIDSIPSEKRRYWHYSSFPSKSLSSIEDCLSFANDLKEEGRKCYNAFTGQGFRMTNLHIAVMGRVDQEFTRGIMASLGGFLRDIMPGIVADHANLGVDITGFVYVPYTINQHNDANVRRSCALFLEQLNTVVDRQSGIMYNHLVMYQDVQYQAVRYYAQLSEKEVVQLQFQYLVNIYLCSETTPCLFDQVDAGKGMCTLGAVSLFYNGKLHELTSVRAFETILLKQFRSEENSDDGYADEVIRKHLKSDTLGDDHIEKRLREGCDSIRVDLRKLDEKADPHPILDLFSVRLFPSYYLQFLRYMPVRVVKFLRRLKYAISTHYASMVSDNRRKLEKSITEALHLSYNRILVDGSCKYPTITQVNTFFCKAKEFFEAQCAEVQKQYVEFVPIPKYLRKDYNLCQDVDYEQYRKEQLEGLQNRLKKEPVVLALIVRCFLIGILLVFIGIPLLRLLSPQVINLGNPDKIEWLWILVLFLLPLAVQMLFRLRRHFKKVKRLRYRLLALTLREVNDSLSALLYDQKIGVYRTLAEECHRQVDKIDRWSSSLSVDDTVEEIEKLPQTLFSQDILTGSFNGAELVKDKGVSECRCRLDDKTKSISDLTRDDCLSVLRRLFKEVNIVENASIATDDEETMIDKGRKMLAMWGVASGDMLDFNSSSNIGKMIDLLGGNLNLDPAVMMAGINGMFVDSLANNTPSVRVSSTPARLEKCNIVADQSDNDNLYYTTWQQLPVGVNSSFLCNYKIESIDSPSFSDILVLYYCYFRQRDLAYRIADIPVSVSRESMSDLDEMINKLRLCS